MRPVTLGENRYVQAPVINDSFSSKVYEKFIQNMDGQHRFFLNSDINNFNEYKYLIDDQIKDIKIDFFIIFKSFLISNLSFIFLNLHEELSSITKVLCAADDFENLFNSVSLFR